MKNAAKFTFDTHFDTGETHGAADARARKAYTPEEIETMRVEAREEGKKDAGVRAAQAMAASAGQVAGAIVAAIKAMDSEVEGMRADAAALALAAARKLAGAALAFAPEAEIADAFAAALQQAIEEPRMTVKTAPQIAPAVEPKVMALAAEKGFEGRIRFAPDSALSGSDCRIEWQGGGLERAYKIIDDALADLIARRFAGAGSASAVKE